MRAFFVGLERILMMQSRFVCGSGGASVLLRVPRAARSSLTYAKRSRPPILRTSGAAYVQVQLPLACQPQRSVRRVCRSEIKGEPAKRAEDIRGDRYAVRYASSAKAGAINLASRHVTVTQAAKATQHITSPLTNL